MWFIRTHSFISLSFSKFDEPIMGSCKTCTLKNCISVAIITAVLGLVWGLVAIPVAFFYLPNGGSSSSSECSTAVELEDSAICYEVLSSRIEDFNISVTSSSIFVARNASIDLNQYLNGLMRIEEDCFQVLMPFLCVYHHGGLCGEQGDVYQPSRAECLNISTGVCREIWSQPELNLPRCDRLATVIGNRNSAPERSSYLDTLSPLNITSRRSSCPARCAERFVCDTRTNTCVPECPNWNIVPLNIVALGDILLPTASALGLIAGIGVIIISIIRRNKIYSFPTVLAVYETISFLIHIIFQIITFLDRERLFCTSPSVLESARISTPYCILAGMIQAAYIPLQFNIWWVSHMFVLFWSVSHPFQVKKSSTKRKFLIAHIAILITGILVPIIPIVGIIIYDLVAPYEFGTLGFGLIQSPPLFCTASNPASYFYFIQLPNAVLLLLGLTALMLTIWTVHRKYGIVKSIKEKNTSPVTTTEVKLMIVVSYYMMLEVIYFTGSSQTPDGQRELELYFQCEQNGVDPDNPCNRSGFENPFGLGFFIIFYSLALLLPAVNFLFVVDLKALKTKAMRICMRRSNTTT